MKSSRKRTAVSMTMDTNVIKEINLRLESFGQEGRDHREGGRSATINQALGRHFMAIRYARTRLSEIFTPAEQMLIADLCNGTLWSDPQTITFLGMSIGDGIHLNPGIREKWGIPPELDIQAKIQALSFFEKATIIDAVEIWWNNQDEIKPGTIF